MWLPGKLKCIRSRSVLDRKWPIIDGFFIDDFLSYTFRDLIGWSVGMWPKICQHTVESLTKTVELLKRSKLFRCRICLVVKPIEVIGPSTKTVKNIKNIETVTLLSLLTLTAKTV